MSYLYLIPLASLVISLCGIVISILFKVSGKLRLTIPLVYLILVSTVFSDWGTEYESLAIGILIALVVLSVGSWLVSLRRFFQERRMYKTLEEDMAFQLRKAREMGINTNGLSFDEHQELIYPNGERVFKY
jgi:hypothetical protein